MSPASRSVTRTSFPASGPDSIEAAAPIKEAIVTNALPRGQTTRATVDDVCAMLGVPRQDWNSFARWAADLRDHAGMTPRETAVHRTLDAVHAYVDMMIAERCAQPGNDLLSSLVHAEIDGGGFTADELRLSVTTLMTMASTYESSAART
jgi:cytochrome P450